MQLCITLFMIDWVVEVLPLSVCIACRGNNWESICTTTMTYCLISWCYMRPSVLCVLHVHPFVCPVRAPNIRTIFSSKSWRSRPLNVKNIWKMTYFYLQLDDHMCSAGQSISLCTSGSFSHCTLGTDEWAHTNSELDGWPHTCCSLCLFWWIFAVLLRAAADFVSGHFIFRWVWHVRAW